MVVVGFFFYFFAEIAAVNMSTCGRVRLLGTQMLRLAKVHNPTGGFDREKPHRQKNDDT